MNAKPPPTDPSPERNNVVLYSSAELWSIFTEFRGRLLQCENRSDQINVLGYMICKYNIYNIGSIEPRIRIVNWNARSIRAKKIELGNFLAQHNIDVGVITETRLNPSINFLLPAHSMVRLDRPTPSGRGEVAVLVKQGIRYEILPHPKTSVIEATG